MEKNKKVLEYQKKNGKCFTMEAKATLSRELNEASALEFINKVPESVIKGSKADPNHPYALVVDCVQVSSFFNKNDHYFIPAELWAARNSSKYMLVDWEHDREQIIGCISDSYAVKDSVTMADDSIIDDTTNFDIYNEIVVWKNVFPDYAEKIVEMHKEGRLFVSMECTYEDFDFALQKPGGEVAVVARNEKTDFLVDHIRIFGGTGEYEGYKVGIAFRNISFVGTGFCEKPANPRSYVLNVEANDDEAKIESGVSIEELIENNVCKNINDTELEMVASENKFGVKEIGTNFFGKGEVMNWEDKYAEVQEELIKAKQEVAEKGSKLESVAKDFDDAKTALAEKETIIKELEVKAEELEAEKEKTASEIKSEYEEKLAKIEAEKAELNEKLAEIEKIECQRARKEEIAEYDIEISDEDLFALSDAEYAAIKKYTKKKEMATEEIAETVVEDVEEAKDEIGEEKADATDTEDTAKDDEKEQRARVFEAIANIL